MWFETCLVLKIDLGKSELIPVGDVPNLEEVASTSLHGGCSPNYLPRSSSGCALQVFKGLGRGRGEVSKKVCFVEVIVSLKRQKADSN